jgi:hypothetical protein
MMAAGSGGATEGVFAICRLFFIPHIVGKGKMSYFRGAK